MKDLIAMNDTAIDFADFVYRTRLQALQGIDEIIEDVIAKLEAKGVLDNTYVIFTSDNGYHLGQHRMPGGKSLFYNEDTNIPFVVRGPNVPANVTSNIPGLHLDLAPTFLEIAGVAEEDFPVFFDGTSLLDQWHNPTANTTAGAGQGNSRESIAIEYWGNAGIEAPSAGILGSPFLNTTYKTIRILGEEQSWVYTVWCDGDAELYDTSNDPYELTNLVHTSNATYASMVNRLNALLMVTKSCETDACRDPWSLLEVANGTTVISLTDAMSSDHDDFFADFEKVQFDTCLQVQLDTNEAPYFPPLSEALGGGLGRAYRNATDVIAESGGARIITTANYYGTAAQRNATLADIDNVSRPLTAAEIAAR